MSVRFFDLFRLAASIHLLTELQNMSPNEPAIQFRVAEMVGLLGNIEQSELVPSFQSPFFLSTTRVIVADAVSCLRHRHTDSNYNASGMWAFFIAGAAAMNPHDRSVLHRRLDSTWNSPCGNVWSLRSVLDEFWQRNAEAAQAGEPIQSWKEIAHSRGWTLLLM